MKKRIVAAVIAMCGMLCACGAIEDEDAALSSDNSYDSKEGNAAAVTTAEAVTTTAQATTTEAVTTTEPEEPSTSEAVILEFDSSGGGVYESAALIGASSRKASLKSYTSNVMHNDVVGLVGTPFMVELGGSEATLEFFMTDEALETVPLENLIVLWYNEEQYYYEELYTEYDPDSNAVSAQINESGVYMLTDWFLWGAAWGVDTSEYAHDTIYNNREYDFKVTIPSFVKYDTVSDYWKEGDDGTQSKYFLRTRGTADISVNLLAIHYTDDGHIIPVSERYNEQIELIKRIGETSAPVEFYDRQELDIGDGRKGYMVSYGFLDPASGEGIGGSIWCYYEYSNDTFISLAFNYDGSLSREQKETITQAIKSFGYTK